MFLSAEYVAPVVLGTPNSLPIQGVQAFVEAALLLGGLAVGAIIALTLFCFLTRRFASTATHERWALQFESGADKLSPVARALGRWLTRCMRPS